MGKRRRPITVDDLKGLNGFGRKARDARLALQPATVFEALFIRGVGRKTTLYLLSRNLLKDPEGCQNSVAVQWGLIHERGLLEKRLAR
jgi:hypothetical protein